MAVASTCHFAHNASTMLTKLFHSADISCSLHLLDRERVWRRFNGEEKRKTRVHGSGDLMEALSASIERERETETQAGRQRRNKERRGRERQTD